MRFYIRLIGELALTDETGRDLLPTARKTRALIARLLLADGNPISRAALTDFCWGDRGIDQGRASLRQALYEARALTSGAVLLRVSKTAVWIDTTLIETDLDRLLNAVRADDLATASTMVAAWSPLLTDCDGTSVQIDAWLAAERRQQTDLVCTEVNAAIARALDDGRSRECSTLARFLAAQNPMAEVLGDYQRQRQPSRSMSRGTGGMSVRVLVIGAVLACAAVVIWPAVRSRGNLGGSRVIAVQPLVAAPFDRAAQAVRSALSGDLVHALGGNPAKVEVEQVGRPTARQPNASFLMSGNVATLGGQLRAHLQLSDARDDAILWSGNFSGDPADADGLGEQAATKADAVINCALSMRHTGTATMSDEASRLYFRACDLIEQFRLGEALQPLRQVTQLAPTFARAWADLATTEALTAADLEPADQAAAYRGAATDARHALSLDPSTGLAYYALAQTIPGIENWWRRVRLIAKGLQVEPDGSELNNAMGSELARVGRSREAIAYFRKSMASDPLNPVKTATLIAPLAFDGRLDEADALIDQASRTWPHNPLIWGETFRVQMKVGDPRRAAAMLDDPDRPEDRDADELRRHRLWLRARMDPTDANVAAALSGGIAEIGRSSGTDLLPVVLNMAELGRVDAAYRLAPRLGSTADEDYDEILFRNYLARFRADPRFMALAARRGLVPIWRATGRWPDFCIDHSVPYDCRIIARDLDRSRGAASS